MNTVSHRVTAYIHNPHRESVHPDAIRFAMCRFASMPTRDQAMEEAIRIADVFQCPEDWARRIDVDMVALEKALDLESR